MTDETVQAARREQYASLRERAAIFGATDAEWVLIASMAREFGYGLPPLEHMKPPLGPDEEVPF